MRALEEETTARPAGALARSGMRAVGSFVPNLTAKAFAKYGFSIAGLAGQWGVIVGRELAAYTQPQQLRWRRAPGGAAVRRREGATLVLRVEGARALEVQFQAAQLLERVNGYFGYAAVAALRVVQGPVAAPAPARPELAWSPPRHPRVDPSASTAASEVGAPGPHAAALAFPPGDAPASDAPDCPAQAAPELAAIGDPALRAALWRLQAGVRRGRRQQASGAGV